MSTDPLIDEQTGQNLREFFTTRLNEPVEMTLFTADENGDAVEFTRRFVTELAALSDNLVLNDKPLGDEQRAHGMVSPSLTLGENLGYKVEIHGAPSGHEAGALVEALGLIGSGDSSLGAESRELLTAVDKDVLLYSFVTPTCPHCPGSVLQNHKIAVEAKGKVRSVAVSAAENMELAQRFNVSSVPQQVINEDPDSATMGTQPEKAYVEQVLEYGASDAESVLAASREREAAKSKLSDSPEAALTLTDANFEEAVAKYPFLIVDLWAEWCGPCRMLGPIVEELAVEQKGRMVFGKLDTEANQQVPARFEVQSIPTMLVFKNGEMIDRIVGASPKEALLEKLEGLL